MSLIVNRESLERTAPGRQSQAKTRLLHPAQSSSFLHMGKGKIPIEGCSHLLPLPAFVASSFLGVPCVGDCPDPSFSSFFTTSYDRCEKI